MKELKQVIKQRGVLFLFSSRRVIIGIFSFNVFTLQNQYLFMMVQKAECTPISTFANTLFHKNSIEYTT